MVDRLTKALNHFCQHKEAEFAEINRFKKEVVIGIGIIEVYVKKKIKSLSKKI